MKLTTEEMIAIAVDAEERSRMDRFRRACPDAAKIYDAAEADLRRLTMAFHRSTVAANEPEATCLAAEVAKDIVRVARDWAFARRMYDNFAQLDVVTFVSPTKETAR